MKVFYALIAAAALCFAPAVAEAQHYSNNRFVHQRQVVVVRPVRTVFVPAPVVVVRPTTVFVRPATVFVPSVVVTPVFRNSYVVPRVQNHRGVLIVR